jgi:two-component system LytT family sensor kinase
MKRYVIILLHFAYWIIYSGLISFSIFAVAITGKDKNGVPWAYSIFTTETVVFLFVFFIFGPALTFYTSYFVLFNRFLQKRKIFKLIIFGIVAVMAAGLLCAGILFLIYRWRFQRGDIAPGVVMVICLMPGLHAVMGLITRGFVTSYEDIFVKEKLKNENLEMQLALIKAQINPHFLFNTINNIDVLISRNAEKASSYLNKLSDILRYMLYETQSEVAHLSREIEIIEKYLDLQKIRTNNQSYIEFNVTRKGDPEIAPMLFMPFIENAVKYNSNKKEEHAIQINFEADNERIYFKCKNAYTKESIDNKMKGELGKELAEKRLRLLYPGKYKLDIHDTGLTYDVNLLLSLL